MISIDYVARRLGIFLIVVFLAVTINFAIPRLLPGDPVESAINRIVALGGGSIGDVEAMAASYNAKFGLDKPVVDQYFSYWNDLLHGDLGVSLTLFPATVWSIMRTALLWTIGLLGTSVIISFVIGLTMGGVMAWPSAPKSLRKIVPIFMVTSAVPSFLLAIVLLFVFAISFQVFPSGGGFRFGALIRWDFSTIAMILKHATLPALSIILTSVGFWAISTRGLLVSNLGEDYILHAEARGLRQRRIFLWYGMRNSLLPQLTSFAILLGHAISGSVLVEVIFSYPGIGFKLFEAIGNKDYFLVQGIVLFLAVSIAFAMFILDLVYPLIDPRISMGRK